MKNWWCSNVKILKHGNMKQRKFVCKYCGCEFVAGVREYNTYTNNGVVVYCYADCPECDTETIDSELWEEQNDSKTSC